MNVDQIIKDILPVLVLLGTCLAWFIRLEARCLANDKGLVECQKINDKLETQVRALDNRIVEKLSYIERSLAKIEGRLSIDNEQKHNS